MYLEINISHIVLMLADKITDIKNRGIVKLDTQSGGGARGGQRSSKFILPPSPTLSEIKKKWALSCTK